MYCSPSHCAEKEAETWGGSVTSMTCWLDRRPEIAVTVPAGGMKAQDAPEFLGGYGFFFLVVLFFPFPASRMRPQ